jgi:hypothetical protein
MTPLYRGPNRSAIDLLRIMPAQATSAGIPIKTVGTIRTTLAESPDAASLRQAFVP